MIDFIRNRKTGQWFVLLEELGHGGLRVITPTGDLVRLPESLFDLDAVESCDETQPDARISPQQTEKLTQITLQEDAAAARHAERQQLEAERLRRAPEPAKRKERPKREPTLSKSTSWKSDHLVFWRHYIEPLRDKDFFRVEIHGRGTFKITKSDFQRIFNEVVMSPSYRQEGVYRYHEVPEKALVYFE